MRTEELVYELPDDAIAQHPAYPRDSARLLDTRGMHDHVFADLPDLLRPGDLVVVNNTKVRKARLSGVKVAGGGNVELLVLNEVDGGLWKGLIRPARRIRPGVELRFGHLTGRVVEGPRDGVVIVEFETAEPEAAFEESGTMPLPPYFHGSLEDPNRYQTVFARSPGSTAAPTAGLHFTGAVLTRLLEQSIEIAEIDLHVGLDTFRPIAADRVEDHRIHSEWCSVPEETARKVGRTRRSGGRVVAIGTTAVRALETFGLTDGTVTPGQKETDLYLIPGSPFHVVDLMVTNFHVPGSTLLAMLAAFMGVSWRDTYEIALKRGYRFLSFGDAMLCQRAEVS